MDLAPAPVTLDEGMGFQFLWRALVLREQRLDHFIEC